MKIVVGEVAPQSPLSGEMQFKRVSLKIGRRTIRLDNHIASKLGQAIAEVARKNVSEARDKVSRNVFECEVGE